MSEQKVFCRCGAEIPHHNIEGYRLCSEEGEECYEIVVGCEKCNLYITIFGWGELGNEEEINQEINDYFKENP